MRSRLRWLLCALLASAGCESTPTEVIVVVDTDFGVPSEVDAIRVDVEGRPGGPMRASGTLASRDELPATVSVVRSGGSLGPVQVEAAGLLRGLTVIEREATFSFVEGERRVLRLNLFRSCLGVACAPGETCGEDGCRALEVAEAELEDYAEPLGRLDASTPPGGDAGPAVDAGPRADGGAPDAGSAMDGGAVTNAGAAPDAGPGPDAGGAPDASGGACVGLPVTCGTGGAACTCGGCTCSVLCGPSCEVSCVDSPSCETTAAGATRLESTCTRSTCDINAVGATDVEVTASGGSTVEVDCQTATSCELACTGGSACLLRCRASGSCGISMCPGGATSCPMRVEVCGRACP